MLSPDFLFTKLGKTVTTASYRWRGVRHKINRRGSWKANRNWKLEHLCCDIDVYLTIHNNFHSSRSSDFQLDVQLGKGEGPERARALLVAVCSKQLKRTLVPFNSIDILKCGAKTVYLNISYSFGLQEEIFCWLWVTVRNISLPFVAISIW